ncbi:MAG: YlbF family regulator [Turicibacter sp.]|nr:YlbF family regulator [Turicibacter sp.]
MLNSTEYIELCELIGDEILSLPICQTYKQLQHEMKASSEVLALINQFEKAKENYEEVARYGGKYHPDYKLISKQLMEAKSNLFQHDLIKKIKRCEKEIQALLDEIAYVMTQTIEFTIEKQSKKCGCGSGSCSC